ncbi:hypothetical protein [Limimaricola hongkongensis]|nr:hypothetical protein [Limimaricola hongkongensis]
MRSTARNLPLHDRGPARAWLGQLARSTGPALAPMLLLGALILGGALGMALVVAALPLTVASAVGRPILSRGGPRDR